MDSKKSNTFRLFRKLTLQNSHAIGQTAVDFLTLFNKVSHSLLNTS